jgi:hypothetical protein
MLFDAFSSFRIEDTTTRFFPSFASQIRTRMMTAGQFRDTLSLLEMTQAEFARHVGLGLRTVQGYAGARPIPMPVVILTRLLLGGAVSVRDVDGVRQA